MATAPASSDVVVDSSVLVAILLRERGWQVWESKLLSLPETVVGAPNLIEVYIVTLHRSGKDQREAIKRCLAATQTRVAPFDESLFEFAADAYLSFGKGRHPAALNFGDCMAYALARRLDAPLLYSGDDFAKTDVRPA